MFRPRNGPKRPSWSQKKLKFDLGEKLDHRYTVKFNRESNGDSLKALKRGLDPEMGQKTKYMAKITKFKI